MPPLEETLSATARLSLDSPPQELLREVLWTHSRLKLLALAGGLVTFALLLVLSRTLNDMWSELGGPAFGDETTAVGNVMDEVSMDLKRRLGLVNMLGSGVLGGTANFMWIFAITRREGIPASRGQKVWSVAGSAGIVVLAWLAPQSPQQSAIDAVMVVFGVTTMVLAVRGVGPAISMPGLTRMTVCIMLVAGVLVVLYSLLLPTLFWAASDGQRLFLRLVVHPLLMEAFFCGVRYVGKAYTGTCLAPVRLMCSGLVMVSALFGRLQVANFETNTGAALAIVGVSALELVQRLSILHRDRFYYTPFMGRARATAFAFSNRGQQLKASVILMDTISEDMAIFVAGAVSVLFRLRPTVGSAAPEVAPVVWFTMLQFVVEFATDLVPTFFVLLAPRSLAGWARRTKRTIVNVDAAARENDLVHNGMLMCGFVGFSVGLLKNLLFPLTVFCVTTRVEEVGWEWWSWGPCA